MTRAPLPVSVVIASRNRPELLVDTVGSVLAGEEIPAEIIVVDQSDVEHPTLAATPIPAGSALVYRRMESPGLSRANNLGVSLARHELIVFTHDDVLVARDWLGAIVEALTASSSLVVITGRVLPASNEAGADGFAPSTITSTTPRTYRGRIRDDVVYPMNLAARRTTLLAVGGFDERLGPGTPYPAAEDNDLGHRLLESGYQITYEPRATVYHRAWRSRSEQTRLHHQYGRGQGAFYAKHLALRDPYMLRRLADDLRRNLVRVPRSLAGRTMGPRGRELAYLSGVASGMTRWMATHGRASRRRVRG